MFTLLLEEEGAAAGVVAEELPLDELPPEELPPFISTCAQSAPENPL